RGRRRVPRGMRAARRPVRRLRLAPSRRGALVAGGRRRMTIPRETAAPPPPIADRIPQVTTLHGEPRLDDYTWQSVKDDPRVIAYLEAENAYTEAMTAPNRDLAARLSDEMLGRIQQTDLTVPYREGRYEYYSRTEEGLQYPIHCRRVLEPDAQEQVVL